jgi:hypothetical protein
MSTAQKWLWMTAGRQHDQGFFRCTPAQRAEHRHSSSAKGHILTYSRKRQSSLDLRFCFSISIFQSRKLQTPDLIGPETTWAMSMVFYRSNHLHQADYSALVSLFSRSATDSRLSFFPTVCGYTQHLRAEQGTRACVSIVPTRGGGSHRVAHSPS